LRYADKIQAATLVLHGSEDHRGGVVDQARLLAERLQANGKVVHLRVYDATPHSIPISAQWEEIDPFLKQIIGN
jgi:dipeptidyl aminopeptidase/acylaminoacyl peptidase